MINIVIPMAGAGSRFVQAGYTKPKPFIDVMGKPMIVRVMENLQYNDARFVLIARSDHLSAERETVKSIESQYNAIFVPIDKLTEGAACTVLFARKYINNTDALMIANSDQIVDMNMSSFVDNCMKRGLDGSILTFVDPHLDKKWSFAKVNEKEIVLEVKEKTPISNIATVGIYLFSRGRDYIDSAMDMIINNDRVNNEFYVCPVYNYSIRNGLKIGIFYIDFGMMHGLGTPEDLQKFLEERKNDNV